VKTEKNTGTIAFHFRQVLLYKTEKDLGQTVIEYVFAKYNQYTILASLGQHLMEMRHCTNCTNKLYTYFLLKFRYKEVDQNIIKVFTTKECISIC